MTNNHDRLHIGITFCLEILVCVYFNHHGGDMDSLKQYADLVEAQKATAIRGEAYWSKLLEEVADAARLSELEACVEYLESLHQLQSSHNYYRNAALKLLGARGPK
jgi:hypothetical protein